ncbi:MAG: hypothetical protein NC350_04950 [Corallococcus sp.]|nr:hypothetical protein [Corallococcus sp.]
MDKNKSAAKYMFRNFWGVVPIALLPAFCFGLCAADGLRADFILQFVFSADGGPRFDVAGTSILNVLKQDWWILLIALLTALLAVSLLIVKIETHMRYGVKTRRDLIARVWDNLGRTVLFSLLLFAVIAVLMLIAYGLCYLFSLFLNGVWLFVTSAIAILVGEVLFAVMLGYFSCALPAVQHDDYRFNIALSYSVRLISSKRGKVVGYLALLFAVSKVFTSAAAYFIGNRWIKTAVFALFYLLWFSYYPCLCCKTYEDYTDGERRDLPRYGYLGGGR